VRGVLFPGGAGVDVISQQARWQHGHPAHDADVVLRDRFVAWGGLHRRKAKGSDDVYDLDRRVVMGDEPVAELARMVDRPW